MREQVRLWLILCLFAFVGAAFLFGAAPGVDLWVTAHLWSPKTGFALSGDGWVGTLRYALWRLSLVVAIGALVMLALSWGARGAMRISTRVWGFAVLSYLAGPGLLTSALLKNHWGRARPNAVIDFGGDKVFSPALVASDQCLRNCSFVSGEVSGAATTALVLALIFLPGLSLRARWVWGTILALMPVASGAIRLGMGGHFLSDVIFAAILMGIITLSLFLVMRIESHLPGATPANAWRDLRDAPKSIAGRLR